MEHAILVFADTLKHDDRVLLGGGPETVRIQRVKKVENQGRHVRIFWMDAGSKTVQKMDLLRKLTRDGRDVRGLD